MLSVAGAIIAALLIVLGVVYTGFNGLCGEMGMLRTELRSELREGLAEVNLRLDEHGRLLSEHAESLTRLETILDSQQQPAHPVAKGQSLE